jgi:hypothetical protein
MRTPTTIAKVVFDRKSGKTYQQIAQAHSMSIKSVYLACTGHTLYGACALAVWVDGMTVDRLVAETKKEVATRAYAIRKTRYS